MSLRSGWRCRLVALLALCSTALVSPSAGARDRYYGFGAGVTFDLDPAEHLGVALDASVTQPIGGLLWARGALLGLITSDGFAVVPTLTGVVAVPLGPLELSANAGVHIFGVARRKQETIFSIFGVGGGGALMVTPSESWRIGVRADLTWLPRKLSAPIDNPMVDAQNTFLYLSTMLVVEFRGIFD